MSIKVKDVQLVDIDKIIENPKNPNSHSEAQIERLCKLIKKTGFRNPVVVSNRSGFLVAGHGRVLAAKKLGLKEIPVLYQDFESEAEEFAYVVSDNAIASWSELNLDSIKEEILQFDDFDSEMLGLENFQILEMATEEEEKIEDVYEKKKIEVTCPNEMEAQDLLDDLTSKGYIARLF